MSSTKTVQRAYCPECGEQYEAGTRTCPDDGARLYSYTLNTDDDPLVGTVIDGRFRIDSVLGEGGMGRVYRGVQLSVGRPVAVKVLRPELVDREDVIQRFLREARVISGFQNPNIVNLVDFGQDSEHEAFYLAMELIDGLPLAEVVLRGRCHPNLACEVILQVCQGLSEAHARDVVHRDLKPDNLMVVPMSDGSLQVKILDFGIAYAVQGEQKLTSTGQVFGTASYMSPEQASGGEVDARADVYALGCILYEMLSGVLPFTSPSVMSLLISHVQREPPLLQEKLQDDDVPEALQTLTMRMLRKEAGERPQTVLEVRDVIEAVRSEQGYGPVRVEPGGSVESGLLSRWLRGSTPGGAGLSSDSVLPESDDTSVTVAEFETAETAAHQSAPPAPVSGSGTDAGAGLGKAESGAGSGQPGSGAASAKTEPERPERPERHEPGNPQRSPALVARSPDTFEATSPGDTGRKRSWRPLLVVAGSLALVAIVVGAFALGSLQVGAKDESTSSGIKDDGNATAETEQTSASRGMTSATAVTVEYDKDGLRRGVATAREAIAGARRAGIEETSAAAEQSQKPSRERKTSRKEVGESEVAAQPVAQSGEESGEKGVANPMKKAGEKAVDKAGEKAGDKAGDKAGEKAVAKPVDKPEDAPSEGDAKESDDAVFAFD